MPDYFCNAIGTVLDATRFVMKNISKYCFKLLLLFLPAALPFDTVAQGYYYPPQPGYYPQYPQPTPYPYYQNQQPPQQRRQQPQSNPKRANKPEEYSRPRQATRQRKDISSDTPPADTFSTTGPLISYTWDFNDTLGDLAKAAGVTPNQILNLNNLALSQLRDGQVLKIPIITKDDAYDLDIELDLERQRAREVWRGIRGKKRVALTYDAGGEADGLDTLLRNLTELNVPATFFVTGQFAEDHADLVANISNAGFRLYNHSWSHPEFTTKDDDAIAKELSRTDDLLSSITGQSTKPFWRPPFGDRDSRVLKTAAREGYRSIYWTLDTLDSVNDKKSTDFVVNRVLSPSNAKANPDRFLDGAIILMHVGETGTADAVPAIVKGLRERGFTLVTVEEILRP